MRSWTSRRRAAVSVDGASSNLRGVEVIAGLANVPVFSGEDQREREARLAGFVRCNTLLGSVHSVFPTRQCVPNAAFLAEKITSDFGIFWSEYLYHSVGARLPVSARELRSRYQCLI
jgi:hypothetical protein